MPLSDKLLHKDLTFYCPYCARAIVKKGEWFRTGPKFKCQGCQHEVRLTYADKVALFEDHAHLVTTANPAKRPDGRLTLPRT
jgi:hypothetical protein